MKKTNYENGKIYIIVSKIDRNIKYVGSTCDSLSKRLSKHKYGSKIDRHKGMKIYQYFNKYGWDNAEISLLELVNCKTKMELLKRERFWKDRENPSLNIINPYTTDEEKKEQKKQWCKAHVEEEKQRLKKWYEAHAEKMKQQQKKCYETHKEEVNQKTTCPYCNIILMQRYLKTHLKKSCKIIPFRSTNMF